MNLPFQIQEVDWDHFKIPAMLPLVNMGSLNKNQQLHVVYHAMLQMQREEIYSAWYKIKQEVEKQSTRKFL